MKHWFDAQLFDSHRQEQNLRWGRPLRLSECTDSTNDLALKSIAEATPTGALWVTRAQNAGRGRLGRSWNTNPGEALLLSVLLRYPGPSPRLGAFALGAGLALRSLVAAQLHPQKGDAQVRVKWPNDVLVGDKKLGGVLVETRTDGTGSFGLVVGVGLNVLTQAFPKDLPGATSLVLQGADPKSLSLELLAARLLLELEKRTSLILSEGFSPLVREMNEHDYLSGRIVQVGEVEGVAQGIGEQGQLLIKAANAQIQEVVSGSVTWTLK